VGDPKTYTTKLPAIQQRKPTLLTSPSQKSACPNHQCAAKTVAGSLSPGRQEPVPLFRARQNIQNTGSLANRQTINASQSCRISVVFARTPTKSFFKDTSFMGMAYHLVLVLYATPSQSYAPEARNTLTSLQRRFFCAPSPQHGGSGKRAF
jgi:hypothetical protein